MHLCSMQHVREASDTEGPACVELHVSSTFPMHAEESVKQESEFLQRGRLVIFKSGKIH